MTKRLFAMLLTAFAVVVMPMACSDGEDFVIHPPKPEPEPEKPEPEPEPEPEGINFNIYVDNQTEWSKVMLYSWNDEGEISPKWPGWEAVGREEINGVNFYVFEMDERFEGQLAKLIFNNGHSGDGNQMYGPHITVGTKARYYRLTSPSTFVEIDRNAGPEKEPEPEPGPTPGGDVGDGYAYIFDMEALPQIHIQLSEEEWNTLLRLYDQNNDTDEYIHAEEASFTKNGTIHSFSDVGLRLRGNTSRRRPEGNGGEMHNPNNPDWHHVHFMLNLRKFQKDDAHELGGVRKIHLKWHKDDACYAREIFSYDLFRRYGIWTAINTSYCRLYLKVGNTPEAYYGVYVMLEAIDERYTKRRKSDFKDDKGFLWKCGWSNQGFGAGLDSTEDNRFYHDDNAGTENRAYVLKTEIESFEAAKTQLKGFIRKLNSLSGEEFKRWFSSICDVELLLKTYAVNVAVGMWDDYWCNQNNYYIYFNSTDAENYKFFFIPYDYDNSLGTSSIIDAGRQDPLNWDNGNSGRQLIRKLLQFSDYRKIYVDALKEICSSSNLMEPASSMARIKGWHEMISPYISNDTGEDMQIKDRPAGWGNCSHYRLLSDGPDNFFRVKANSIPNN